MFDNAEQKTVMVIDDVTANLSLLEDALGMHGFKVLSFPRGALALAALQHTRPDLILLDIQMPEMSGYQVNEKLKQSPTTASIPVIFMSGVDDEQEQQKAADAGGVHFLVKPFDVMSIGDTIRQYL